jgi:hypothetical protein
MSNNQPPITISSATDLGNAPLPTVVSNNSNNSYTTSVANSFNNLVNVFLPAVQVPGSTGQTGATGASGSNILQVREKIVCEMFSNTIGATSYQTALDSSNVYVGWASATPPTSTNYGPTGYVGNLNVYSINGTPVTSGVNVVGTSDNLTYYPTFVSGLGDKPISIDASSNFSYNPSTGALGVPILNVFSNNLAYAVPTVKVRDLSSNQSFNILPNSGNGNYNPSAVAGDVMIYSHGATGTIGSMAMNIASWSTTSSGVRLTDTSTRIGWGGSSSTPSNALTFSSSGSVFSGANVTINSITSVKNISEKLVGPTGTAVTPYVCDYNTGSVFFLPASVSSSTFSVRFINVPSITSTSQNYLMTIAYVATSATNYCNTVTLSTTSSPSGSAVSLKYNGGSASIPTIASGNHILQQFAVTYFGGVTVVLTSISVFSA